MKNINIPEPCSEDWNKMAPNEKGAFCQKCALDVYDFTNKSANEIREVLTLNISAPVCMKIEPKQLDQLNMDFSAWKLESKQSYQRAWLFTLLVVFGMTLFSCEEDEEPVVEEYQKIGRSILTQEEENVINPILPVDIKIKSTTSDISESSQVELKEVTEHKEFLLGKSTKIEVFEEKFQALGEVMVVEEVLRYEEPYALGGVPMISPDYNHYLITTYDGVVNSIDVNIEPKIKGLVYPNPASNVTTLKVNMPKRGKGEIELFGLNGQKIKTIHAGRMKKGESEYPIDLTNLETGFYLCVISSGDLKETIKFSKI